MHFGGVPKALVVSELKENSSQQDVLPTLFPSAWGGHRGLRAWVLCWVLCARSSVPVSPQGVAVLGIALIAMGEEIGAEMGLRTFGHLVSDTRGQHRAGKGPRSRSWVLPHSSVHLAVLGDLGLTLSSPLCSCAMGSPLSAVLCPWPWLLSQSPIHASTSSIPSASSPMTLTPRSPTTPSLPWAWWAVVSLGPAWFGVCLGRRWETLLCLHLLVPRYQQRPAGSHAATAGPVPRQGPQQPLHGAAGPGDDAVLTARVWKGKAGVPALGVGGEWCPGGVTLLRAGLGVPGYSIAL